MKKKKITRKQEALQTKKLLQQQKFEHEAKTALLQVMFKAFKYAAELYSGVMFPDDLMRQLGEAIDVAITEAKREQKDLDLQPIIEKLVADYKNPPTQDLGVGEVLGG